MKRIALFMLSACCSVPAFATASPPPVDTPATTAVITDREFTTLSAETIEKVDKARVGKSAAILRSSASARNETNNFVKVAKEAQAKGNRAAFDNADARAREQTARACAILGC